MNSWSSSLILMIIKLEVKKFYEKLSASNLGNEIKGRTPALL